MTREEFSNQFDVLLNSYSTPAVFGSTEAKTVVLDEYEKSVYLTKAQEEVVIALYSGSSTLEGFEATEEDRRYLANLVEEETLEPITQPLKGVDKSSKFFKLSDRAWFITYEAVTVDDAKCKGMSTLDVYPVTQDDYHKTSRNPFRGANDRRALRLDVRSNMVEIVSKLNVTSYYVRYVRKPKPIILVDLPDGLKIEGEDKVSDCELPDSLHNKILTVAVSEVLTDRATAASATADTTAKEAKTTT